MNEEYTRMFEFVSLVSFLEHVFWLIRGLNINDTVQLLIYSRLTVDAESAVEVRLAHEDLLFRF